MLKLNPWPFNKDEAATLYWLCSPYQNSESLWIITAVFKNLRTSELIAVEYPWGTLPFLRLGRIYKNKTLQNNSIGNHEDNLVIEKGTGHVKSAWNIPSCLWPFYRNSKWGQQKVYIIKAGNITYYIPCIELIRAYFAPNVALANQILQPNGLDFWVVNEKVYGQNLYIEFHNDMPRTMLNKSMVQYFTWLRYNHEVKAAWDSVYNKLANTAVHNNPANPAVKFHTAIPLECNPAKFGKCKFQFRGFLMEDHCLVIEITEVKISELPFSEIEYSHPGLVEYVKKFGGSGDKTKPERRKTMCLDHQLGNPEIAATQVSNPEKLDQYNVNYEFAFKTKIHAVNKTKKTLEYKQSDTPNILPPTVTTQDRHADGKVRPIDIEGAALKYRDTIKGLEEFFQGLDTLQELMPELVISTKIVELNKGAFAYLNDGSKRKCAVVSMCVDGQWCGTLIEVARPDEWKIATLLVLPKVEEDGNYGHMQIASSLVNSLIGHWNVDYISSQRNFNFLLLRHYKKFNALKWGTRIEKIIMNKY